MSLHAISSTHCPISGVVARVWSDDVDTDFALLSGDNVSTAVISGIEYSILGFTYERSLFVFPEFDIYIRGRT